MHRTVPALLAGAVLLTASACGTASNDAAPATPATISAVGATCEALARVYAENMGPYARALTALTTDPKTVAQAQQALAAFATAVREATRTSADTQMQAAGQQAAKRMHDKSTDTGFFSTVKTTQDVTTAIGPTLSDWLSPVKQHCG
jgi:nitrous oxide reductase accessory protein NosL